MPDTNRSHNDFIPLDEMEERELRRRRAGDVVCIIRRENIVTPGREVVHGLSHIQPHWHSEDSAS